MSHFPEILHAQTMHVRKGEIKNHFRYNLDMMLIDPEAPTQAGLFSRNRFNVFAIHDTDYGLKGATASPAKAVREIFEQSGLKRFDLLLLTQPRVMGMLFNPVSFWIALKSDIPVGFLAEVNNTFKERHFYLCHHKDFSPITAQDKFRAKKVFYVSPFQEINGEYEFNMRFDELSFAIRIDFQNGEEGLLAALYGRRVPISNRKIFLAALRQPIGGVRITGLIFYQALKLKIKGAVYRVRPKPPSQEVSS